MKKFLLIPDSFKGTMTSIEICNIMEAVILEEYPDSNIIKIPVADGGEGSVDAFIAANGGKKILIETKGPYFEDIQSFFGIISKKTAIIEMAASAGLPLVGSNMNAKKTTTFGVGQLIEAAILNGAEKIILGLGGSATNDGGCGAAAALGAKFINFKGEEFIPIGETLGDIARIDITELKNKLRGIKIIAMCDIDNPLCGTEGAAAVFGPQKGANAEDIEQLDNGLSHLAKIIKEQLSIDVIAMKGAGAAGGMGAGSVAFFSAELRMGIQVVLDTVKFDELLTGTDMVFTGEGKIDTQSLRGKVIFGIAERTRNKKIPLTAVVGDIGDGLEDIHDLGLSGVFSINRLAIPFTEAKVRAKSDLYLTMKNILHFMNTVEKC